MVLNMLIMVEVEATVVQYICRSRGMHAIVLSEDFSDYVLNKKRIFGEYALYYFVCRMRLQNFKIKTEPFDL